MATYSSNTTIKINRAISGADTVNANAYAIVDYVYLSGVSTTNAGSTFPPFTKYFGPGQAIPATLTVKVDNGGAGVDVNYGLASGVEFKNTP